MTQIVRVAKEMDKLAAHEQTLSWEANGRREKQALLRWIWSESQEELTRRLWSWTRWTRLFWIEGMFPGRKASGSVNRQPLR